MSNKSVEEELRDTMYRMKLNILNERIQKERYTPNNAIPNYIEVPVLSESRDYERDLQLKRMNLEIDVAKRKYEKLKEKLKLQKLENKLSFPSIQNKTEISDNQESFKFNQHMEMLMLQQTQTQNMLMNQLLLKSTEKEAQPLHNYPSMFSMYPYYGIPEKAHSDTKNNAEKLFQSSIFPLYNYPSIHPMYSHYGTPEQNQLVQSQTIQQESPPQQVIPSLKPIEIFHQYPGNEAQQNFRKLGLAVLFCAIVESDYEENSLVLSDKFLFDIKIQEIITSIQRYYLNTNQPINNLLQSIVSNEAKSFRILLTKSANNEISQIEQQINNVLLTLVTKISEIMPTTGTLGCESKSILSEIIQNNQIFPEKYFYTREKDLIKIDSTNTVRNLGLIEAQFILIGIFYIRALVVTVLLKSTDYGLAKNISTNGIDNLRILSSIIVKIYRTILAEYTVQKYPNEANKKIAITGSFIELNDSLLSDEELEPLLKYVKKTIDSSKVAINKWANTYIMKMKPA